MRGPNGITLKVYFFPVRPEESQFALISIADADLMVASFVVKTDKI